MDLSRYLPPNPSGETSHAQTYLLERGGEERILLEAVAAATLVNQLLLDRWKIKPHSQTADHIEVLEGYGDRMERAQGTQDGERRLAFSRVTDTSEIRIQVDS